MGFVRLSFLAQALNHSLNRTPLSSPPPLHKLSQAPHLSLWKSEKSISVLPLCCSKSACCISTCTSPSPHNSAISILPNSPLSHSLITIFILAQVQYSNQILPKSSFPILLSCLYFYKNITTLLQTQIQNESVLSVFIINCQTQNIMGNQVPKKGQEPQAVQNKKSAPEASEQQKAVKIQKTMLVLDRQIKVFQDKQKKSEVLVDQLKAKAKQLVMMGKKNDAKKYLQQATRLKKQTQNYTIRRRVLENKKFQLETAMMDKNTVSSLESAQQHLKDQQKVNDKLEEIIFQTQQQKMVQDQLNEKLKDMAEDDDMIDEVDDMMAEIERELNKEKGAKIPQKTVNTNVNVQKQKQAQEDEISKMMAEL